MLLSRSNTHITVGRVGLSLLRNNWQKPEKSVTQRRLRVAAISYEKHLFIKDVGLWVKVCHIYATNISLETFPQNKIGWRLKSDYFIMKQALCNMRLPCMLSQPASRSLYVIRLIPYTNRKQQLWIFSFLSLLSKQLPYITLQ